MDPSVAPMTRHPVVHSALSVSGSVGAVKGIQRVLQKYLPDEWLFSGKVQSSPTNIVPSALEPTFVEDIPLEKGLSYTRVLSFVVDQLANMDARIAITIVVLTVIGPVLPYLFGIQKHVPQTAAEHLDPAQRALLQFGKSKSEPILLSYVSMDLEQEVEDFSEGEDIQDPLRRREVSLEASQELVQEDGVVFKEEHTEVMQVLKSEEPEPMGKGLSAQEESDDSTSGKQESSSRSVCTLPSAQTSPLGRRDSYTSHANVYIQFSPMKTSNLDAQLSSEQAYSQPFTY